MDLGAGGNVCEDECDWISLLGEAIPPCNANPGDRDADGEDCCEGGVGCIFGEFPKSPARLL